MPIPFSCNSCGRSLNVRDDLVGKQIYCPDCKSILTVPHYVPPPPEPEEDIPMAAVAAPAAHDDLSARAEEPPPPPPIRPAPRDDDDEFEDRPRRPTPRPIQSGGPSIGAILGGIGMMVGAFVLVLVGLATGIWVIKGILLLGIAGIVTFIKGLVGKSE